MADSFHIEIASPERRLADEDVTWAELPGKNGFFGVLPDHAPLLSSLGPGVLTFTAGGHERKLFVNGGFVEVYDNRVSVLAEQAMELDQLDVEAARQELAQAQEAVDHPAENADQDVALDRLHAAQVKLEVAEHR